METRETSSKEMLSETPNQSITLVACGEAGEVIGFASGGVEKTSRLPCDGELHAIYLLEASRGQGVGTLLVRRLARELQLRRFSSMAVWALGLNSYRRFYEALGPSIIGEKTIERSGKPFVEIAYDWQDLGGLQCERNR